MSERPHFFSGPVPEAPKNCDAPLMPHLLKRNNGTEYGWLGRFGSVALTAVGINLALDYYQHSPVSAANNEAFVPKKGFVETQEEERKRLIELLGRINEALQAGEIETLLELAHPKGMRWGIWETDAGSFLSRDEARGAWLRALNGTNASCLRFQEGSKNMGPGVPRAKTVDLLIAGMNPLRTAPFAIMRLIDEGEGYRIQRVSELLPDVPLNPAFQRGFDSWEGCPVKATNYVFLAPGLFAEIEEGAGGRYEGFTEVDVALRSLGHDGNTVSIFSLMGNEIDEHGRSNPQGQKCTDTLRGKEEQAWVVIEDIKEFQEHHPHDIATYVTHSWASIPFLEALQKIKDGVPGTEGIDLSRIRVIVVQGPNKGLSKPFLRDLARVWPFETPENCKIFLGLSPSPKALDEPSGRDMLKIFEMGELRDDELLELAVWFRQQGGEIYAFVNYNDCVLAFRFCNLEEFRLGMMFLKNRVPRILLTQEIPGAINITRFLGNESNLGHAVYLEKPEQRQELIGYIGPRNSFIIPAIKLPIPWPQP